MGSPLDEQIDNFVDSTKGRSMQSRLSAVIDCVDTGAELIP